MKVIERSVQEIGKSLFVSLPKQWADNIKLTKQSKLKMFIEDNGTLFIAPFENLKNRNKNCEIKYDLNFKRRFFKVYFENPESISVLIKQPLTSKERKDLSEFLNYFMNIQIIDETKEKIVIKIFTINELSIEECAKRMHFLSLNLFDNILENKSKSTQEIRDNMTRFYYMLVMQVRRFLEEGKYAEKNQISLIRAMDLRMVAEKIQRIGESLSEINLLNNESKQLIKNVEDYYTRTFRYFTNNDFDKASELWDEGKKLLEKCEKKNLDLNIKNVIRFTKEIGMLVR